MNNQPRGELWVNVRDYGAIPDGSTDNSIAIQAAIDDLISKIKYPNSYKGTVFFPSAPLPYAVTKTVWVDSPNIEIRGEGWGSQVQMLARHSTFLFGVRRVESEIRSNVLWQYRINEANRSDLYGKLDTSVVKAPGQKWGIRTNGNSFAQFQHGPMACGPSSKAGGFFPDYWAETNQLTLEFAIEPPDGQSFPLGCPILGMGTVDFPSPFLIQTWDEISKFWVGFQTSDGGIRSFGFRLGAVKPPYRIAIQFDLINAACSVFVNSSQVPLVQTQNITGASVPPFTKYSSFIANEMYPFMIGCDNIHGPYNSQMGIDFRLYGLRISKTLRYYADTKGRKARLDSLETPVSDFFSYFSNDQSTICFLAATDNPAKAGRTITVQHGMASAAGPTSGLFMHTHATGGITGNTIRDIQIVSGTGYGAGICLGGVQEMTISNVKSIGGFQAIGSFNMFAAYTVYIDNCWLEGIDSCYCGYWTKVVARNIYFGRAGRDTIRHLGGSGRWENWFVAFSYPITQTIFKAKAQEYGGQFFLENGEVDFEGDTIGLAAIYCEAIPSSSGTTLTIQDVFLGTVGSSTSLVMLKDGGPLGGEFNRCWLSVKNLQAYTGDYAAAIDVDGPLWHGEVEGTALIGPPFKHRQKWRMDTNIVISDTKFSEPPNSGSWYAGAHRLIMRNPLPGQPTEWRCIKSGTYGTANEPVWAGINPLPAATPPNLGTSQEKKGI